MNLPQIIDALLAQYPGLGIEATDDYYAIPLKYAVKSGDTTQDELNEAIDAVRRAGGNLCCTVLNDLNMKSVKYAYKYKYGGKYGYKYSYSESYEAR